MILDQDAALSAVQLVDHTMFYKDAHRRLFRAMHTLTENRVVIDHVTLRDELIRRNELELCGGIEYLAELVDSVATAAHLEHHARIVRDKATLRGLIEASTGIIQQAYEGRMGANELLDDAEGRIFRISQHRRREEFTRLKEMLWDAMERIESLHRGGVAITGVPSGFPDLDNLTSGFQRSELIIVAARPSMGKTAFCLNIASNAAQQGKGVAIFSLEMSKDALVQRLLCSAAGIDSQAVRQGRIAADEIAELTDDGLMQVLEQSEARDLATGLRARRLYKRALDLPATEVTPEPAGWIADDPDLAERVEDTLARQVGLRPGELLLDFPARTDLLGVNLLLRLRDGSGERLSGEGRAGHVGLPQIATELYKSARRLRVFVARPVRLRMETVVELVGRPAEEVRGER